SKATRRAQKRAAPRKERLMGLRAKRAYLFFFFFSFFLAFAMLWVSFLVTVRPHHHRIGEACAG
ncbi:MAG: hypothetical protein ACHQ4G_13620, partial [Opitutales bacterium]